MHHRSGRLTLFSEVDEWSGHLANAEPEKCEALHWVCLTSPPRKLVAYARVALRHIDVGQNLATFGWEVA